MSQLTGSVQSRNCVCEPTSSLGQAESYVGNGHHLDSARGCCWRSPAQNRKKAQIEADSKARIAAEEVGSQDTNEFNAKDVKEVTEEVI